MNIISKKYLIILKTNRLFNNCFLIRNHWQKSCSNCLMRCVIGSSDENSFKNLLSGNRWTKNWSLVLNRTLATEPLDVLSYERIADQLLEHLCGELEEMIESNGDLKESDVSLSNGVITLNLGFHGIYVINKQTPNKQIWFSSPVSGPKRYDYVNEEWIYKRDGISLFSTLSEELSSLLNTKIQIK